MKDKLLNVEIWSDVVCPFCYIGKRKFEEALKQFGNRDHLQVTWKSFQLNPDIGDKSELSGREHLARSKGWSPEFVSEVFDTVTKTAAEAGLTYKMEDVIIVNSFNAHRLIKMAEAHEVADKVVETLFNAHFTEGKNIASPETLTDIGINSGISSEEISRLFNSEIYSTEVRTDIYEAQLIGARAVPFLVINKKISITGARGSETFLSALNQAWTDLQVEHK